MCLKRSCGPGLILLRLCVKNRPPSSSPFSLGTTCFVFFTPSYYVCFVCYYWLHQLITDSRPYFVFRYPPGLIMLKKKKKKRNIFQKLRLLRDKNNCGVFGQRVSNLDIILCRNLSWKTFSEEFFVLWAHRKCLWLHRNKTNNFQASTPKIGPIFRDRSLQMLKSQFILYNQDGHF